MAIYFLYTFVIINERKEIMNFSDILIKTFSDTGFQSAIASTLFIILLGYFCRKRGIFSDIVGKVLSSVTLSVSLPALAFTAFMNDIDPEKLRNSMNVLIWGFAIYVILIFVAKLFYRGQNEENRMALENMTIFGSTTFFGTPIINAVYGAPGVIYANVFNIAYRVFLYSYGYVTMSGTKFKKENAKSMFLNPIVIATVVGLLIWIFQGSMPQVAVGDKAYAFLRIDKTLPWLYEPLQYLSRLASPLAWLAIGATLGEVDMKAAFSHKLSWYYCAVRLVVVPLINLICILALNATGLFAFNFTAAACVIVMMATPPATVIVNYAIGFDRGALLSSNCSLLGTVAAVVAIPLWLVVLQVISTAGIL